MLHFSNSTYIIQSLFFCIHIYRIKKQPKFLDMEIYLKF